MPTSVLDELLETACLAPSVGLSEPWRFVLVNDANRRDAIRQNFMRGNTQELEGREGKDAQRYARLKLAGLDDAPTILPYFVKPTPNRGAGLAELPCHKPPHGLLLWPFTLFGWRLRHGALG